MKGLYYLFGFALLLALALAASYLVVAPEAVAPAATAVLMFALPLGLGALLARRLKTEWRLYGLGALTFVGSQALHLPFNALALSPFMERLGLGLDARGLGLVSVAALFGLSAGVFEEGARYLVYRRWLPQARAWRDGLMFGAGHGGVEALLLGVLYFYSLLQLMALRGGDLSALVPAEQVEAARQAVAIFWGAPWYEHLLPALERASALCMHLAMSLLVLQAFTRRNPLWLGAAIGWHTLIDAAAVYGLPTWGAHATEGLLVLLALASLGIVFALRAEEEPPEGEATSAPPPSPSGREPPEVNAEKLEDSRYA